MNKLIPLYVTASLFLQDRVETYVEKRKDFDRGASFFEYAALIAVIAGMIGVWHNFNLGEKITSKLGPILDKLK
ncbi:hypothetical protein Acsp03_64010 [Actinomadura sp. NBRC 104412]|uniref:hypothetical protein n=1 Tax=Actinomadura sp. NBRC 104412 TaxID=3032203 RepID=UPI00249FBE40|nr:hypothetical protein [Actinomadura sp. NBRC 104412]GLZ08935.1 hypothetical protein Acsp03_64010 [Actinomadura sp. NBRC 104412]